MQTHHTISKGDSNGEYVSVQYTVQALNPLCLPPPNASTPNYSITVTIPPGATAFEVMKVAVRIDNNFYFTHHETQQEFSIESIGETAKNENCYWSFNYVFKGLLIAPSEVGVSGFVICCNGYSIIMSYVPIQTKDGTGRQSPINIVTSNLLSEDIKSLTLMFWNTELSGYYDNTGHTVRFTPSIERALVIRGSQIYKVCQFHIHWGANSSEGSEHVIDGHAYAGELHIVAVKDALTCDRIATYNGRDDALVVGVFLKAGNTAVADTVWERLLPVPRGYNQAEMVTGVHLDRLMPNDKSYYFYEGSLTTEPYNEIVQWYILKIPMEIPEDYLQQLRSILDKEGVPVIRNHREIQPLYARKTLKCADHCMVDVK